MPMTKATLRPLMPEDAPAAVALWHDGWHDAHAALLPPGLLAARGRGFFADQYGRWAGAVIGAFVDRDLVGLALVTENVLDQFHVARPERGTGLAREFLAGVERILAEAGHREVRLGCVIGNDRALRFYERAGYRVGGQRSHEFEVPPGAEPVTRPLAILTKYVGEGPEFRAATEADEAAIVALWHDAWHDGHGTILSDDVVAERTLDIFAKRFKRLLPDSFVAVVEGELAAFAVLVGDEIDQFYVAAKYRGTGLAKLFLSVLERALAKRGVEEAVIQCAQGNIRAHRFYSRCGWTDTGVFDLPLYTADGRHAAHPTHLFKKTLR